MPRKDVQANVYHTHPGNPGDCAHPWNESKEGDSSTAGELGEIWNTSWEAAWIDLGGEG